MLDAVRRVNTVPTAGFAPVREIERVAPLRAAAPVATISSPEVGPTMSTAYTDPLAKVMAPVPSEPTVPTVPGDTREPALNVTAPTDPVPPRVAPGCTTTAAPPWLAFTSTV